ncbi:hypothetical protein [Actinoplanes sp. NPDC026619]|uniref:hypothetical protein n=1 Tax=Actinoplanes sp. NPDC026619 TaxID=3155798 RepID=UPI0033FFA4E3
MKRALIVLAVGVLALVAVGVFGQVRRAQRIAAHRADRERVMAAHPLEVAAASIDSTRRDGFVVHFSLVPPSMPPGIVRMWPSGALADDGVTDIYEYGAFKVAVNFTGIPGADPCGGQPCVRDADLTVGTDDAPSLHHVAVWMIGAATPEVQQFWAKTGWVPTAKAGWFADLAAQGRLYARH